MTSRQHGLALIAVLWMVAALGLIATSMMQTVRTEAGITARPRDVVFAAALGESAMQLALQAVVSSGVLPDKLMRDTITYAGVGVAVQLTPLNGFIDINKAPVELLQQMLQIAGGLPQDRSGVLAQAIVERRATMGPGGKPDLFEAPDDLLRVIGLDYPIYAQVASLVTTDAGGSGRVNPLVAPPQVLRVLMSGNDAAVANFVAGRDAGQVGLDQSAMNSAWLDLSGTSAVELQAVVPLVDGGAARVVRRYLLGKADGDGLPWRVFYSESFFAPPVVSGH